jgi:hypothetical protein
VPLPVAALHPAAAAPASNSAIADRRLGRACTPAS